MPREGPFFSVVVPTHARPALLEQCLAALARLRYPRPKFEVLVIDDGGLLPAGFGPRDLHVEWLRQPRRGPAAARNRGARQATGRYLAFTDDDCRPAPDWLSALEAQLAAEPGCAVGGRTVNAVAGDACAAASQWLRDHVLDQFNGQGAVRFVASSNLAVPAAGFRELGGFDEGFPLAAAEDRDFCDRWTESGRGLRFAPDAIVDHHHEYTVGGFLSQHAQYGRGAVHYRAARERRGQGQLALDRSRFYRDLFRAPARHRLLLGLSQAAYFCGVAFEAARRLGRG